MFGPERRRLNFQLDAFDPLLGDAIARAITENGTPLGRVRTRRNAYDLPSLLSPLPSDEIIRTSRPRPRASISIDEIGSTCSARRFAPSAAGRPRCSASARDRREALRAAHAAGASEHDHFHDLRGGWSC